MEKLSKLVILAVAALTVSGCASTFIKASYKNIDVNKDEVISIKEFSDSFVGFPDFEKEAAQKGMTIEEYATSVLNAWDVNEDGLLSYEEYLNWARNAE